MDVFCPELVIGLFHPIHGFRMKENFWKWYTREAVTSQVVLFE